MANKLSKKQKKLLDLAIERYKKYNGHYPCQADDLPEIEGIAYINQHETFYQNANRYMLDELLKLRASMDAELYIAFKTIV